LTKEVEGKPISVYVNQDLFNGSVHSFLSCQDCHPNVKEYQHEPAPQAVSCAQCHAEVERAYSQGLHAQATKKGSATAASCLKCHGNIHEILPSSDPQSKVYRTNIPQMCGSCHGVKFVMEASGISAQPFFSYRESVHGRAVEAGSLKAAVCSDCHRSHDVRSAGDPQSPIFKFNVPETCGQCHPAIAHEFNESIHGQALRRGNWQAAVCTDCHGIHLIKPHIDPTSSVASQALARTTCAQCHEGVRLSQEYGVAAERVSTYLESYHGLASRLGSTVAANCASCHGIHNILPSSDPRSTISQKNLVSTCGKCHPGASEKFARGKVHFERPITKDIGAVLNNWIRKIYIWLIVVLIGSMLVHNGLVWRKKAVAIRRAQDRPIIRMTSNQRIQHLVMLSSFIILALTGFALKYPNSWLAWLLGSSETIRRLGHRIAAAVMLSLAVYHVGYTLLTKEGWQTFKDFLPRRKDITDLIGNLRYSLGLSSSHPKFGRYGYAEKAEYWALVWGVLVMGVTGLMAWFKVETTSFLPRWAIDVAMTIHFYEAVLATLAIVVWHFYHVIFDPDVYPMNWAWWDGRVSIEWYQKEHPLAVGPALEEKPREQEKSEKRRLFPLLRRSVQKREIPHPVARNGNEGKAQS